VIVAASGVTAAGVLSCELPPQQPPMDAAGACVVALLVMIGFLVERGRATLQPVHEVMRADWLRKTSENTQTTENQLREIVAARFAVEPYA